MNPKIIQNQENKFKTNVVFTPEMTILKLSSTRSPSLKHGPAFSKITVGH